MSVNNYMKNNDLNFTQDASLNSIASKLHVLTKHRKLFILSFLMVSAVFLVAGFVMSRKVSVVSDNSLVEYLSSPIAVASTQKGTIAIPAGVVKANPFVPYRSLDDGSDTKLDVPSYALLEPPDTIDESSDAARVMDTIVSGILYDKHSPSAILNIEGSDYLVKKGDVVNGYKVMNIEENSVTVKLGANTYNAGIGEILTDGNVNYNVVSNLSKKFGGER